MDKQQQVHHQPSPSEVVQSPPRKRYIVTLNAATTAVQHIGDPSISYIDQGVVYHLSVLDTDPTFGVAQDYHTVVRIYLNDDWSKSPLSSSWSACTALEHDFCTIQYSPYPQDSIVSPPLLQTLRASSQISFSVTWRSDVAAGASYCLIPITFSNLKNTGGITLKLCASTERIRVNDVNMSSGEGFQESFGLIRLFSEGNAQSKRVYEIHALEQKAAELELAIAQTDFEVDEMKLKQKHMDEALLGRSGSKKQNHQRRKTSDTDPESTRIEVRADFSHRLSAVRRSLSSVRPVQVFQPMSTGSSTVGLSSQQIKYSTAPLNSIRSDSRRFGSVSNFARDNGTVNLDQTCFTSAEAGVYTVFKKPSPVVRERSAPMTCFYVRPEHLPNANYRAIYLRQRSFPELLHGISSKLQVHINAIGKIYCYDKQKTLVVVNEMTIMSLANEQDMMVSILWSPSVPACSVEEDYHAPVPNGFNSPPTQIHLTGMGTNWMEQHHDQADIFDEYLEFLPETPCGTSVVSWSEFTDDKTMSRSETFASCSTGPTSMSLDDTLILDNDYFRAQLVPETSGIHHDNGTFDTASNIPPPWLSSVPLPPPPPLPLIDTRPALQALLPAMVECDSINNIQPQWLTSMPLVESPLLASIYSRPTLETSLPMVDERPNDAVQVKSINAPQPLSASQNPPVSRKYSRVRDLQKRTSSKHKKRSSSDADVDPSKIINDKYVHALQRNRIAAMKCRVSRKERELQLQEQSQKEMQLNEELKQKIRQLGDMAAEARALWEQHDTCG